MVSYIVDASLAVKWLVREVDSDQADQFLLRTFGDLHAPDLLLAEVGQTLVRRANERLTAPDVALSGMERLARWSASAITLHEVTPALALAAAELAVALVHPIKDCIYLALADELGCLLATSDVKFRDRVGDPARVRCLAELV